MLFLGHLCCVWSSYYMIHIATFRINQPDILRISFYIKTFRFKDNKFRYNTVYKTEKDGDNNKI